MRATFCYVLLTLSAATQPRSWPTDIFDGQYSFYGRITDPVERTLTYIREEFDRNRRVIERKLNGYSTRALFETNLVHFIAKDYHRCTTQSLKVFKNDQNDVPLVWTDNTHHLGQSESLVFASIGELLKSSKMVSKVIETKVNKIRGIPAWSWSCILSYQVKQETITVPAFVYFTVWFTRLYSNGIRA